MGASLLTGSTATMGAVSADVAVDAVAVYVVYWDAAKASYFPRRSSGLGRLPFKQEDISSNLIRGTS